LNEKNILGPSRRNGPKIMEILKEIEKDIKSD